MIMVYNVVYLGTCIPFVSREVGSRDLSHGILCYVYIMIFEADCLLCYCGLS